MRKSSLFTVIVLFTALFLQGCGPEKPAPPGSGAAASAEASGGPDAGAPKPKAEGPCVPDVEHWSDGIMKGKLCTTEAEAKGLLVVNLSDDWAPFIFSDGKDPKSKERPNEYRAVFNTLTNDKVWESRNLAEARAIYEKRKAGIRAAKIAELRAQGLSEDDIKKAMGEDEKDLDGGAEGDEEKSDDEEQLEIRYLELYGIPPSLASLRLRAVEESKRSCYKDVDFASIGLWSGFMSYVSNPIAESEARLGLAAFRKHDARREKLKIATWSEYVTAEEKGLQGDPSFKRAVMYKAILEAQKRLLCGKLFPSDRGPRKSSWGAIDWPTHEALAQFERRNRIFGWGFFNTETAAALARPPAGEIYEALVRVLTERVVDASAVLEDGTSANSKGEMPTYTGADGQKHEVRNLVSEFSADVLHELGLATPDKAMRFLMDAGPGGFKTRLVAVKVPPLPEYYGPDMDLRIVIDRGDVWYDFPYRANGTEKHQPVKFRPKFYVHVKYRDQMIPLARWGTTIGGWRSEMAKDNFVYYRYKNSDVGPRVWRYVIAAPVWLPPDGTPYSDLLKKVIYRHREYIVPNYDEFGPGFLSAYGLVMAPHEREVVTSSGKKVYFDNGIRSHGSFDYMSIQRRHSHGCHRLYNHLALRLFGFVLRHRAFDRIGQQPVGYWTKFEVEGETYEIRLKTKGYAFQLKEPVQVDVLKGNIKGKQQTPIEEYVKKPGLSYEVDGGVPDAGVIVLPVPSDADASPSESAPKKPAASP